MILQEGAIMRKNIRIEFTDERIIPNGGLAVVGSILGKSDFIKKANRMKVPREHLQAPIKNGDVFLTYIGMLCMGKPSFEAVHEMDDDPQFYKDALGIAYAIPSSETLRQRMDEIGTSVHSAILKENVAMMKANGIQPSPLDNGMVPVDMDVSPFDNSKTKKEGVSRTYKGCDGYAPIFAYIGREGYLADLELRAGKQHCQKDTPEFLRETIEHCRQLTDRDLLFRLDSGNDATENMGILLEKGCYFIIKRNLRKEDRNGWLEMAKKHSGDITSPRDGKTVYIGSDWKEISYTDENGAEKSATLRMGYEIIERTTDKHGQFLLVPDVEVNMWWTNTDFTDRELIGLYHAHGESEQFHSELKSDMDLERLPSGKFGTNALVLDLAILAYNILRMIGCESLGHRNPRMKRAVRRRRHRTVIENLMHMACHVTEHARSLVLGLGKSNVWRDVFQYVYTSFIWFTP